MMVAVMAMLAAVAGPAMARVSILMVNIMVVIVVIIVVIIVMVIVMVIAGSPGAVATIA